MNTAIILFITGLILMLLGVYFWRKGDPDKPFWAAILETITDMFLELVFTSYRTWALILWLIGFVMVFLGCFSFFTM
ncbi:uncharacterized membrane protein YjjP (DUF1212 family) [Paenibacillus harenae]|uniref:Uncharacterized membrane protein YjjP (DUF1212 family) n=1 Tax=Paenibacillus harenae TaxID=306543 RepID=A0ABT9U679_PAEHA|nr:uncharacterized membrane protein YjjP (DUF1212 family) [Paenibacillus harenae]